MKEEKRIAKFFCYFEKDEEMQIFLEDRNISLERNRLFFLKKYPDLEMNYTEICSLWDGYCDSQNQRNIETNKKFRLLGRQIFDLLKHKKEIDIICDELTRDAQKDWENSKLKKLKENWAKSSTKFFEFWLSIYPNFPVKNNDFTQPFFQGFGHTMNGIDYSLVNFQNSSEFLERLDYSLGQKLAQVVISKL
jgi:hypothetical protein